MSSEDYYELKGWELNEILGREEFAFSEKSGTYRIYKRKKGPYGMKIEAVWKTLGESEDVSRKHFISEWDLEKIRKFVRKQKAYERRLRNPPKNVNKKFMEWFRDRLMGELMHEMAYKYNKEE